MQANEFCVQFVDRRSTVIVRGSQGDAAEALERLGGECAPLYYTDRGGRRVGAGWLWPNGKVSYN